MKIYHTEGKNSSPPSVFINLVVNQYISMITAPVLEMMNHGSLYRSSGIHRFIVGMFKHILPGCLEFLRFVMP